MRFHPLFAGAVFAAVAFLAPSLPAEAATARASDPLTIYAGPGSWYAPIGRLPQGAVVTLAECTPRSVWCRIEGGGWVLGSYLVGSAAKVEATPWRPLVNPFYRMFPHRHPFFAVP
ncbi:MAG: SH3 domain-containing protein [Devosia sp.]